MTEPDPSPPDGSTLLDRLGRHRRGLLFAYLVVFAVFLLLSAIYTPAFLVEIYHGLYNWIAGAPDPWKTLGEAMGEDVPLIPPWEMLLSIAVYLALQAAVIWGGGRIRLSRQPAPLRNTAVSMAVIAFIAALLTVGAVMLYMEGMGHIDPEEGFKEEWQPAFLAVLLGGWIFWFAAALFYTRRRGRVGGLAAALGVIFAGSWIEFAAALPIDVAARTRNDCYCATGGWLPLLLTVPIMLWVIGPALYLLYVRERDLAALDPHRARAILRRKSASPSRKGPDA